MYRPHMNGTDLDRCIHAEDYIVALEGRYQRTKRELVDARKALKKSESGSRHDDKQKLWDDAHASSPPDWRTDDRTLRWLNIPRREAMYSLAELENRPTIAQGQFSNLKIQSDTTRVWLSRMKVADGAEHDHGVEVEHLIDGRWTQVTTYPAL